MTLFTLLLILLVERLFKPGERYQLENRLHSFFTRQHHFSLVRTAGMTILTMLIVLIVEKSLHGIMFGFFSLLLWVAIGGLSIGAGIVRQHYHQYLKAASADDVTGHQAMALELSCYHPSHPLPEKVSDSVYLRELQNTLLWINYRFYIGPIFWFVAGGKYGPVFLAGYAFLRAFQGFFACNREQQNRQKSGVDTLLFIADFIPVRLAGLAYAFIGHGEKALPIWFRYLKDIRRPHLQIISHLAQYALERSPAQNHVEMPREAVAMAKKITLFIVVIVSILTLSGVIV